MVNEAKRKTREIPNSITLWRETQDVYRKGWRANNPTINVCYALVGVPWNHTDRIVESLVQSQRKHMATSVRKEANIIGGEQILVALNLFFARVSHCWLIQRLDDRRRGTTPFVTVTLIFSRTVCLPREAAIRSTDFVRPIHERVIITDGIFQ